LEEPGIKRNSLINNFIVRSVLGRLNSNIEHYGFANSFKRILDYGSRKMEIQRDPEVFRVLSEEPVLLITNHPSETDALVLLGCMPQKENVFIIIAHVFLNLLPAFDKHCIPVYIDYRAEKDITYDFLLKINPSPIYTEEESKVLNKESIKVIAQKIHEGGLVIFAPGYGNDDKEFKTGLGHILNLLPEPEKVRIVMTYIRNTSKFDYLRILPYVGKLLPRFRIAFSPAAFAKDFVSGDVKADTVSLQNHYHTWVRSLIT